MKTMVYKSIPFYSVQVHCILIIINYFLQLKGNTAKTKTMEIEDKIQC